MGGVISLERVWFVKFAPPHLRNGIPVRRMEAHSSIALSHVSNDLFPTPRLLNVYDAVLLKGNTLTSPVFVVMTSMTYFIVCLIFVFVLILLIFALVFVWFWW